MRTLHFSPVISALLVLTACSAKPTDATTGTSDLSTPSGSPFEKLAPTKLAELGDVTVEGTPKFEVVDDDTAIYSGASEKGECVRTSFYLARAGKTPAVRPLLPAGAWFAHRVSQDKKWIAVLGAPDAQCSDGRQDLYLAPLDGDEAGTPVSLGAGSNDFDFFGQTLVVFEKSAARAIDISTREQKWKALLGGEAPLHVTARNGKGLLLYTSKAAKAGTDGDELMDISSLPLPTGPEKQGIVAAFDPAGTTLTLNVATNGGYTLFSAPITTEGTVAKSLTSETLAEPAKVRADGTIVFDTAKAANIIAPGATETTTFTATGKMADRQLSLDGKWIGAFVGDARSLAIAPTDKSGALAPLALSGISDIGWFTFSQDAKNLIFSGKNASGKARLFTLALPVTDDAKPKELPVDDPAIIEGSIGSPSSLVVDSNTMRKLVQLETGDTTELGQLSDVVTWKNEILVYRTESQTNQLKAITSDGRFNTKFKSDEKLLEVAASPSGKSIFFESANLNAGGGGIYRVALPTYDKSKVPPPADKKPGGSGTPPSKGSEHDSTAESPSEDGTSSSESDESSESSSEDESSSTTTSPKPSKAPAKKADSGCSIGPANPLSSGSSPSVLAGVVAAALFAARRRNRRSA